MATDLQEELRHLLEMRALQTMLRQLFQQYLAAPNAPPAHEFCERLKLNRNRFQRFVHQGRALSFDAKEENDLAAIEQIAVFVQETLKHSSLEADARQLLDRTGELLVGNSLNERQCGATIFPEFALTLVYELKIAKELILDKDSYNWMFARAFGQRAQLVEHLLDLRGDALQQLVDRDSDGNECPSDVARELAAHLQAGPAFSGLEARARQELEQVKREFDRYARAYEDLLSSVLKTGIGVHEIYNDHLELTVTHHSNIRKRLYQRVSMETVRTILRGLAQLATERRAAIGKSVLDLMAEMPSDTPSDPQPEQTDPQLEQSVEEPRTTEAPKASPEPAPVESTQTQPAQTTSSSRQSESEQHSREIRALWQSKMKPVFGSTEKACEQLPIDRATLTSVLGGLRPLPPRERLREIVRVFRTFSAASSIPTLPVVSIQRRKAVTDPSAPAAPPKPVPAPSSTADRPTAEQILLTPEDDQDAITDHCTRLLEATLQLLQARVRVAPLTHRATKLEMLRLLLSHIQTINPEHALLQEAIRGGRFATSFEDLVASR